MVRDLTIIRESEQVPMTIPDDVASFQGRTSGRVTVYCAGAQAAAEGLKREACPYADAHGSKSFRTLWLRGYEAWHKRSKN